MGHIYADVELINMEDLLLSWRHIIGAEEVKRMQVRVLVDTGAYMLTINETIQQQLQLPFLDKRKAILADGRILECDVVWPIELRFKNRKVNCSAMVLAGDIEPLLGVIPMEEMDVLIHPQREELIVNPEHPYFAQLKLK
jgi:clan AA aspartic protease